MFDTNILVSALILDSKLINELFEIIYEKHTLVISSYIIQELLEITEEKFPDKFSVIDRFLYKTPYEFVYTPKVVERGLFDIRDADDYPVLYTAIIENIEVLVTGDKDLLAVEIDYPAIMNPRQFLEIYG